MAFRKILAQFNIPAQCRSLGLSLWQCPQFLFLVMGVLIIVTSIFSYLVGSRYIADPAVVALLDLLITTILLVIAFVITRNFERLAEISRMKSEFINIVTHQLRAPLTNLKWAAEFLTSKELGADLEKKEEYYSTVRENIGRMVELLNNLLIVAKIGEGTIPLSKKEISFENLVRDLISRFKAFAEASNIKINFYPQENLPLAFVDPAQMKLVVENLLDNAIRYTKGGGLVEIWLERRNKSLYFKIKDSGVGIPEKDKKFIFEKFFRSENILRNQTQGSGLGLYITKSIIDKSGGKIWFESEGGKGTTFYFTLPIK